MKTEFLHMMILDGCFLVQIVRKFVNKEQRDINDPVFNMDCMFQYICHDLLLLENQIPWFVLQYIYELTVKYYQNPEPCLSVLILTELSSQPQLSHNCRWYLDHLRGNNYKEDESVLHILDLIRTSIVFSFTERYEKPFHDANTQLIASARIVPLMSPLFFLSRKWPSWPPSNMVST
ncbi:hypothetical protein D8674_033253 [Pyrus ussuriensis x Pyrus communis]|uniref:Uncharacterized protein n=1 Tax=Pyrus ussuriensis x Pyrus communis TaxID=2448454 RepID=A0A5N5HLG5_9ROSA|nr:hypothetical protein D8674_033253 [Pyrus ussuriensis x Pyrus communis]